MSDRELDELSALCDAATPGPWTARETGTWPDTNHWLGIYCGSGTGAVAKIEGWGQEARANADLIAAVRTDLPLLIKRMRLMLQMADSSSEDQLAARSLSLLDRFGYQDGNRRADISCGEISTFADLCLANALGVAKLTKRIRQLEAFRERARAWQAEQVGEQAAADWLEQIDG